MEDTLVDVLWLQSCVRPLPSPDSTESSDSKSPLAELVQALVESIRRASFVTKLQSSLLPSIVGEADLSSEQDLLKRLKVYNTQMFYKQQKYNLLQEETEGFSKAVSFLSSSKTMDDENCRQKLFQLMGTFELDPHRVMDLALDVLAAKLYPQGISDQHRFAACQKPEKKPHVQWLLDLLPLFSVDALPSLVAFKLTLPGCPSEELKHTIAFLVVESFLDFDVVMNKYEFSVVKEIEEAHKVMYLRDKRRIQALTKVSLSGTTKEDPKLAELSEQLQKLLLPLKQQPLLGILYTLMQWQDWSDVKKLLPGECWGYLADLIPQTFGFALCDIAQFRLQPWYQTRVSTPGFRQANTMKVDTEEIPLNEMIERLADPLMCTLTSSCILERPTLFVQLCQLLKECLPKEAAELWSGDPTYDFLSKFILPSMSLYASNPAIPTEVWGVLKQLPYATRYRLYEDWKGEGLERWGLSLTRGYGKPLFLSEMELKAGKAARYALKRLSKDNIHDMSRQLAKVTNFCPLVVYSTILNQMESYDNMVEVMVDAQRFTNPLGLDVLSFCILSRLSGTSGGVNRSLLKEDGVNVSQWLQSLEAFVGAFHKRHPFVEFRGILAYLMRRLRDGHVLELGMIRTLLKVPGGYTFADYSPVASLSAVQIQGRAGSVTLNREIMSFGIAEDVNVIAAQRIREVLQSNGVGVSMLILIAHARSRTLFESSKKGEMPVKLVANLFDTCQVVLSILLDFLTTDHDGDDHDGADQDEGQVSGVIEQYASQIPTFKQLHEDYGLEAETAWKLCRPLIRHIRKLSDTDVPEVLQRFQLSTGFRDVYTAIVPESTFFKHALFECFFVNSLHDIFCPDSVYDSEQGRVTKEIERLERSTSSGNQGGKAEQENLARLKKLSESLTSEHESHKSHVEHTLKELEEKKATLFDSDHVTPEATQALLTNCVYPRSLQTPDDAMYCSHFVFKLHDIATPGFSTLHYIDELIAAVSGSLFGLTENEAANVAVLLWQTWSVVNSWRYEEGLYDSAVAGKPGSYMKLNESDMDDTTQAQQVEHKDFVALYNRWHATLGSALTGCLQSTDYMHLRTGLLILTRVVEVFPTRPKLGNKLFKVLRPLQDEDSDRPDIRAAATAYGTMLLKARDDGKWIEEDASVAKARAEKEKAAAEERKKALEKRFDEMEQDSKKITEEIGPRDRFERRRDGNVPNGNGQQNGKGPTPQTMESPEDGEVPNRARGATSRDTNRERSRDSGRTDEKWPRNLSVGPREEGEERRRRDVRDDDRRRDFDREREADRRRREERSNSRERERRRDGDRGRDVDRRRHDRRSDNWEREPERRDMQRNDDRSNRNRRSSSRDRGGPRDNDRDRNDSRRRPERRSITKDNNDIEIGEEKGDNRGSRNQAQRGRSRGRQAKDGGQAGTNDEGRGSESRSLEKRWVQSDSAAGPDQGKGLRSNKRGRTDSPPGEDGRGAGKRARIEPANKAEPKPDGNGRAPSPSRQTRSGAESGGGSRSNRSGRSRRRR
eukprot:Nitzschia sp. Nitz4//scaffold8_size234185//228061//232728//NITZ4_001309-RA/size234185-processed-gene-0.358-mRNA-1//1//CDS//3329559962//2160//frame0